jgi:NAD+ synthase (glutamine-hydrolysing)
LYRKNRKPIKALRKNEEFRINPVEEIYRALVMGTKDYVEKNGFSEVVIGLSGGIDSALTATIAVDALGSKRVVGVFLPSQYTSLESDQDVHSLVKNLNIRFIQISIQNLFREYTKTLKKTFGGIPKEITEENIQARIRGNLLMALSNNFKWLVLTTGNKSEMSVGYATLYGDMAGGFAVIKDVPKMMVYRLARYRNGPHGGLIPQSTIKKEPSAELKPNQKDVDSLPPYRILDPILKAYVEEDLSFSEIVQLGFDWKTVRKVIDLVDNSEYKRRQAPPGIKITPRAFGKDRRMPITNRYKDRGKIP